MKIFEKVGEMIIKSSDQLLEKETLTLDDIEKYLERELKTDKFLKQSFPEPQYKDAFKSLQMALSTWRTDRRKALFQLVNRTGVLVGHTSEKVIEAMHRAILSLASFPLVKEEKKELLVHELKIIGIAEDLARESGDAKTTLILHTYYLALIANVTKFHPDILGLGQGNIGDKAK